MIAFLHRIKSNTDRDIQWTARYFRVSIANLMALLISGLPADKIGKRTATDMLVPASDIPASEIKKTIVGSVVTWEGTYQGRPIRVRIFGEPVQEPGPVVEGNRKKIVR